MVVYGSTGIPVLEDFHLMPVKGLNPFIGSSWKNSDTIELLVGATVCTSLSPIRIWMF